jgi:muramoyltetrapeptide carboxypeptidase LdcA involved in peptidoglycan recycling
MMIKPEKLNIWDCIAVVSPSRWWATIFPHIFENWVKVLEKLWYQVKQYPSCHKDVDFLYNNPEFRANDINDAFADKEVKAIISSIWGDESIRILKYLDKDLILQNPKIFMGYSDITTINIFLNQLWLVTFNWPQVMAWISQFEDMWSEFQESFKYFFENVENYEYKTFPSYSNWYLPRWDIDNVWKLKEKIPNEWWNILQWSWTFSGKLIGGCLQVLDFMKWTEYFPQIDFFKEKIFFMEIAEDNGVQLNNIKYTLRNYCISWIFQNISWLLIWRARDFSAEEKEELNQIIVDVVVWEFWLNNLPIITNLDFGHTDPQRIMPLWIEAEFDIDNHRFYLQEKCFSEANS